MAHSEKSRQSEGSVYVATIVSADDSAFDPVADIIEDLMPRVSSDKDGPDECVLQNVCSSEHMIHLGDFCCDKWRRTDWKPNPACPKESDQNPLVPSNAQGGVLVDLKSLGSQGTGMDLLGKIDFDADLESGREINGTCSDSSFLSSARGLVVKAWWSFMKGHYGCSFGGTKTAGLALNQKLNKLFVAKHAGKQPNVLQPAVQRTDSMVAKTSSIGSEGIGKLRTENGKVNLKPSSKKPPRPPRPPRADSNPKKERLMKGYSDMAMSRAAKLERMRSLMKNKVPKSSSSNSSIWALVFTLCFCIMLIMQGLYSQGAGGARDSSVAAVETSPVSLHSYGTSARSGGPLQAVMHQTFVSLSSHSGLGGDKARPIPSHPKAWRL